MKLRNKKTGEIQQIVVMPIIDGYPDEHEEVKGETSLKDFNEEWEDYEEPKEYWYIDLDGEIQSDGGVYEDTTTKGMKEIGNYFETKEEAEKAVEKLKAYKRVKDKGFKWRYNAYYAFGDWGKFWAYFSIKDMVDIEADLGLLFGDEE